MEKLEYFREDMESKIGRDRSALHELLIKVISEVKELKDFEKDHGDNYGYSRYDLDKILDEALMMRDKVWEWEPGVFEDED